MTGDRIVKGHTLRWRYSGTPRAYAECSCGKRLEDPKREVTPYAIFQDHLDEVQRQGKLIPDVR